MIKNASNLYPFALQDQLSNGLTGQTPSVFLRQDNGSFAAASGSVTEVDSTNYPGLYQITLTAAECNCDVLTIAISLPDGQEPAILDVVYPVTTGGATPAEIWGYTGGRTVDNTIPTAADNATAVWGAQTKIVNIDSTQIATLATADALTTVGNNVSAVKAKTDNLPSSPAAVGSEMALTSAAIASVKDGLATISATDALAGGLDTLANYGDAHWSTATGFATPTDVSNAQTAIIARGNEAWTTATGFTVPGDLSGLATAEGLVYNLNLLTQHGNTYWITASGFATPSDIPSAQDIWEYPDRGLTTEIVVGISEQNIADITESVWNADDRTLTDLTPKPNQKSIVCTPSNVINSYGIPRLENWTNETAGTQAFDDKINTYITLAKEKMATDLNDQINAAIAYIGADNITELCAWLTGYNLYQDDESTDTDSLPETRYNQYLEQIHRIMENI